MPGWKVLELQEVGPYEGIVIREQDRDITDFSSGETAP